MTVIAIADVTVLPLTDVIVSPVTKPAVAAGSPLTTPAIGTPEVLDPDPPKWTN